MKVEHKGTLANTLYALVVIAGTTFNYTPVLYVAYAGTWLLTIMSFFIVFMLGMTVIAFTHPEFIAKHGGKQNPIETLNKTFTYRKLNFDLAYDLAILATWLHTEHYVMAFVYALHTMALQSFLRIIKK